MTCGSTKRYGETRFSWGVCGSDDGSVGEVFCTPSPLVCEGFRFVRENDRIHWGLRWGGLDTGQRGCFAAVNGDDRRWYDVEARVQNVWGG